MLERVWRKVNPFAVGVNVNWYSHNGKPYGGSLKKLKIKLPYDPATLLLFLYPDKAIIQKDTCTPMFIVTLFTIAMAWNQSKYPSTEE